MLVNVLIISAVIGAGLTAVGVLKGGTDGGFGGLVASWIMYSCISFIGLGLLGLTIIPALRWW